MKKLFFITLILLSLFSQKSISETFTMDELVLRNDLYYKKFTNIPFTGKVSDIKSGNIVNGKKNGEWISYYGNGQLSEIIIYKNGKIESNEFYYENGQLIDKLKYKDGKEHGIQIRTDRYGNRYHENYKDGIEHGLSEGYFSSGNLMYTGSYKDGKKNGLWEYYFKDGSIEKTETWKNGIKQN